MGLLGKIGGFVEMFGEKWCGFFRKSYRFLCTQPISKIIYRLLLHFVNRP